MPQVSLQVLLGWARVSIGGEGPHQTQVGVVGGKRDAAGRSSSLGNRQLKINTGFTERAVKIITILLFKKKTC